MNKIKYMKMLKSIFLVILSILFVLIIMLYNKMPESWELEERIKAATIPGNIGEELYSSGAPFNLYSDLRYSDLSFDLRERISREEFESITNYFEAQKVFNSAYKEAVPFPANAYRITQPILIGTILVDGKWYHVDHKIAIGYDYYIKPVIIEWYIDIEPYE